MLYSVGWFEEPPKTPEEVATKPIQPPDEGRVFIIGG
jgi:hypothetical protein